MAPPRFHVREGGITREVQYDSGDRWTKTSVVDEEAVDHERDFGLFPASGEMMRLRVAQRIDYDLLSDPIGVRVHPPRIHVGDIEFSARQIHGVYEALGKALAFTDEIESPVQPEDPPEVSAPPR